MEEHAKKLHRCVICEVQNVGNSAGQVTWFPQQISYEEETETEPLNNYEHNRHSNQIPYIALVWKSEYLLDS